MEEWNRPKCDYSIIRFSHITHLPQSETENENKILYSYVIVCLRVFSMHTFLWCVLSGEATNTNVIVFVLTQPGIKPTIYCTRSEYASHYPIDAVEWSCSWWWPEDAQRQRSLQIVTPHFCGWIHLIVVFPFSRKVWGYQRGNQKQLIEEGQTIKGLIRNS